MLKLYTYYRSVSTHRVRIALNLKGVPYTPVFIDQDQGEHLTEDFNKLNPQGLVPALVVDDQIAITQSFAILEYLEDRYPERPLLPEQREERAKVRSFAQIAVADMNPLNILRVFHYMRDEMELNEEKRREWYEHWAHIGFRAMESTLERNRYDSPFCFGPRPTLADVCLVPQVYSARHAGLDLTPYPLIRTVDRQCDSIAAFQAAAPNRQSDQLLR